MMALEFNKQNDFDEVFKVIENGEVVGEVRLEDGKWWFSAFQDDWQFEVIDLKVIVEFMEKQTELMVHDGKM